REPAHHGALAWQELRLLTMGAKVGLLNLYRRALQGMEPGARRSTLLIRVAGLFEALGDTSGVLDPLAEAIAADQPGTPYRGLARLAESQRFWRQASDALGKAGEVEDLLEQARLLALRLKNSEAALERYGGLLDEEDAAIGAALGAAALAQRSGDNDLVLRAHTVLAERVGSPAVRAAHSLWSGQLAEAAKKPAEALRMYSAALELRGESITAFEGVRRQLLASADVEALQTLWTTYRPDDLHTQSLDLETLGATEAVAEIWRAQTDLGVAGLARLEVALAAIQDWEGVYAATSKRAGLTKNPDVRADIDAKRRWLLAEKLADSDDAWTLYQELHEENPGDREVTGALAGIAMARGETRVAIGYLETLAQHTEDKDEAASLQVRVGEVHEAAGSVDDARKAYLDALDYRPDHTGALGGLRRLAVAAEDWDGLIQVQKREAALAEGDARVELLRTIARTTQERLSDDALAVDAWRAVLDAVPEDATALDALYALATAQKSWETVLDLGGRRVEGLKGAARSTLLRELGVIAADELNRDDAYLWFERACEQHADLLAARKLQVIYHERGDINQTVKMLILQADLEGDSADKARLLADAADLVLCVNHDRDAAAEIYRKVLLAEPNEDRALRFLAEYLFERNDDQALEIMERLAPTVRDGQDVDDFDVRLELSTFYFRLASRLSALGRSEEALNWAEHALEINAAHLPTLELVAPLLIEAENWKRANFVLREILQRTGGQGDKASMADTYTQLGVVERALGRGDKASKRFSKALDLVPNHIGGLKGMASVLEDRESWQQLLNVYNNIIYHAPDSSDVTLAYLTKGRILDEHMGRPDKAAQHYERSLAYDANQPDALLRLAELAMRRDDWSEAGGLAQRGLQLATAPGARRSDLLLCWAAAKRATGDGERARAALIEARASNPEIALDDGVLDDLSALRESIRSRLPR
ncbi:MAG: tetratricopeptide (TPR) repeat protein, partial [Kiritimatiellia bacterium]